MRSPAEFYFKFLIVHPDGYDNATLKGFAEERGFDWISDEYVNRLRARMRVPEPFFPADRFHSPSIKFLREQQLLLLFQPDDDARAAIALLDVPRAREFIETMLLSHAPIDAIAKTVVRYGRPCTRRTIESYAHFFWNVDLLDSTQMKVLLNLRFERIGEASAGTTASPSLHAAGKKASYQDPRKLAAELPFSPFAALLVQMRMGISPGTHDVAQRMTATRDMAAMRALESLHFATPGDASRALNYAMTAKIMNELLETVQKPDEQLREQLSAIALRSDDRPVPSIHQLSAGQHTVDLQPTPEGSYEPEPLAKPVQGE